MKPSHITTPRCLSDATFTVGCTHVYTLGEDLESHEPKHCRMCWFVALVVIALCLLPFVTGKL